MPSAKKKSSKAVAKAPAKLAAKAPAKAAAKSAGTFGAISSASVSTKEVLAAGVASNPRKSALGKKAAESARALASKKPATGAAARKPAETQASASGKADGEATAKSATLQPASPEREAPSKASASAKANAPAEVHAAIESAASSSADIVDSQLARYRTMRDFGVTAEPSGAGAKATMAAAARTSPARAKASGGLPFVVQKHAASHLHYDFRLGWAGVLKSWAVAKGPSYYTGDRRLAVQVEDHPMEYGGFEGVIPKGQYGGGTVMVWDQGTWWPQLGHENVEAGLRDGSLKFELHGSKLKGKWTLVRMAPRAPGSGRWGSSDKPNWLLIKEHDEFERKPGEPAVTEAEPNSAVTGRSMEEIARAEDHVWNSRETAGPGQAWYRQESAGDQAPPARGTEASAPAIRTGGEPRTRGAKTESRGAVLEAPAAAPQPAVDLEPLLAELPTEPQPAFLKPQLAQETSDPPDSGGWLHELKLDGYRMQARKAGGNVEMLTRSGLDWTYRIPAVAEAVARLPVENVTLDGEVVVVAPDGTTNFADLQASFQEGARHPLTYFVFDLLHVNGHNPRELSLRERKGLLLRALAGADGDVVRLSEHLETGGSAMFRQACELHAEGIISKRASAPYRAGRSPDWLKSKCLHEQEFVIGGYTVSSDGADRIGSLLLGYYDGSGNGKEAGKLVYAGRTGTGFTQRSKTDLMARLSPLAQQSPAFARVPSEARRDAVWVKPELVAQVRFATWTAEDLVRQAAFLGLREDKAASEVLREEVNAPPTPKRDKHRAPAVRAEAQHAVRSGVAAKVTDKGDDATVSSPRESVAPEPLAPAPKTIRLTHPEKVLDPESGLTKQQLADYYWFIADFMLPHIANRPLSLVRCPEGAGKPCFFQKHVNHMLPKGIGGIDVPNKKTGEPESYITLDSKEALAGLAQMGVLEVHPWGSCNDDLERPDRLIFDLDPDEGLEWSRVCDAAAEVRSRLLKAGLISFLKTTGGKGLHLVVPVVPDLEWPAIKELAHNFVRTLERDQPDLYLTKMTKAARRGKIYLDYLRNERGATAVAPYSPRAREGAPVSLPLPWSALQEPTRPVFTVLSAATWRVRLHPDPWRTMATTRQRIDPQRFASL